MAAVVRGTEAVMAKRTTMAVALVLATQLADAAPPAAKPPVPDPVTMTEGFLAAHPDLRWRNEGLRGVVHCFTGDKGFASQLLERSLAISFSGIVSFNNAAPLREVAWHIPGDRLLIETDCPYLTPKPHRGRSNEPAFVVRVAEVLAEARGTTVESLAALTLSNAEKVFQLEKSV